MHGNMCNWLYNSKFADRHGISYNRIWFGTYRLIVQCHFNVKWLELWRNILLFNIYYTFGVILYITANIMEQMQISPMMQRLLYANVINCVISSIFTCKMQNIAGVPLQTWIKFNHSMGMYMPSKPWDKLLIHSQTSTVALLKFRKRKLTHGPLTR